MVLDSRTLRSTPESGGRGGYDGAKRKKGSKVHAAVGTVGQLLAGHVSPANEQDREQVEKLARVVQEATGESVELAYVDQGYTGQEPVAEGTAHGIELEVGKRPEGERDSLLLPRRWIGSTACCGKDEPVRTSLHERLLAGPATQDSHCCGAWYVQSSGGPHLLALSTLASPL